MTAISPFSSTTLSLLVRVSDLTPSVRQQTGSAADNILKAANGVSSEPSQGMRSATSAAGMLTIDLAEKFSTQDASSTEHGEEKITYMFNDLGTFHSLDEAKAYVQDSDRLSESDKKKWLSEFDQMQEDIDWVARNADRLRDDLHAKLQAATNAEKALPEASNSPGFLDSRQEIETMNNFLIENGRQGMPNYDRLLERTKYA